MKRYIVRSTIAFVALALMGLVGATANADTFSFNLDPPNTAADAIRQTIRVSGVGIFDTSSRDVLAMGSFKVFDASGALVADGTWSATDFVGFDSFGGLDSKAVCSRSP